MLLFDQKTRIGFNVLGLIGFSFSFYLRFGHAQISVPKIGIPMTKIVCINPWGSTLQHCKNKLRSNNGF